MAVKRYIPIRGMKTHLAILLEIRLLKKHFPFLKFQIKNGKLLCHGYFQPSEFSPVFHYIVEWCPNASPKVFPLSPKIAYNDDIHMYSDGSLCLYYPKDFLYTCKSHIHETIIPWTHEWFVFYELYQIIGRWLHPYVEHKKI
ncbi:hypothetical protein [Confluentibacter flavum]|uniref:Type II CBASS E2 protein domain-containing protein n=1 Tax=Confluentibacter flavum TaxID=1909700 RepID=A0A2N3HGW4_9FLAO|nr:hypothetical protein [Confluentibacter flavum]PKQ44210.1 hypothetical protein CSW08_13995 [Confluentibacter flavum]